MQKPYWPSSIASTPASISKSVTHWRSAQHAIRIYSTRSTLSPVLNIAEPSGESSVTDESLCNPRTLADAGIWALATRSTHRSIQTALSPKYTSGSTSAPKGVMLSHYNVGSNLEQLEQVFGLGRKDCVLGILPFFHSFSTIVQLV